MVSPVVRTAGFRASSPTTSAAAHCRSEPSASPDPVMATLPKMRTTTTGATNAPSPTMDYLDEFSQFDETFGTYKCNSGKNNNNEIMNDDGTSASHCTDEDDLDDSSGSTLWDVMLSLYVPVLLLWLRRSMFGTANLVRSLVLGHCLRLLFGNFSEWMTDKTPSWVVVTLQSQSSPGGSAVVGNGKLDPQAWPPPALVALALLTVFTLVVHPDGFTWVMVGKLRDFMLSLFHSSTQCWNIVIDDYGIIPTIAATTTFAALLFLSFCMLRTLSPRTPPGASSVTPVPPEKRKKKRKGQARHRGGGSNSVTRIKISSSTQDQSHVLPDPPPTSPSPTPEQSPPDLTPLTPLSSAQNFVDPVPSPCSELKELPETSPASSSTSVPFLSSPSQARDKDRRLRVSSVSTLDTSALSDDQSCESTSVRSIPSVSVSSSRSFVDQEAQHPQKQPSIAGAAKSKSSNSSLSRRSKKNGKGKSPKRTTPDSAVATTENAPLVASSRWDALKPKPPNVNNHNHHARPKSPNHHPNSQQNYHQHGYYGNHNNHNNVIGNNNNHHHNNHSGKHHGRGGGRNNRKGRGHGHHHQNHNNNNQQQNSSAVTAADHFFSKHNSNAVRSNSPVSKVITAPIADANLLPRSPESPPVLAKMSVLGNVNIGDNVERFGLPKNPIPPPPPGLGPFPASFGPPPGVGGNEFAMSLPQNYPGSSSVTSAPSPLLLPLNDATRAAPDDPLKYVSHSLFLNDPRTQQHNHFSSPSQWSYPSHHIDLSSQSFSLPALPNKVKENPFAPDEDSQIEADLQELGGQMAGSILDF